VVDQGNYPDTVKVTAPNAKTVDFIRELRPRPRMVAEIGIYRGHTSREIAKLLPPSGELHLFDFQSTVDPVVRALEKAGHTRVVGHGNSDKVLDSYNWSLMKVIRDNPDPIYDYVFIDGAHTWLHDGLAYFLVDRLLKPGGHVDFDDYDWSFAKSPSLRPSEFPKTAEWYTPEQIEARQVALVVDLLVRRDPGYLEVVENRIFRKAPRRSLLQRLRRR
jgi:predicted O-methyltransferase YrrM